MYWKDIPSPHPPPLQRPSYAYGYNLTHVFRPLSVVILSVYFSVYRCVNWYTHTHARGHTHTLHLHRLLVVLVLLDSVMIATCIIHVRLFCVSVCSLKRFEDKNSKKN